MGDKLLALAPVGERTEEDAAPAKKLAEPTTDQALTWVAGAMRLRMTKVASKRRCNKISPAPAGRPRYPQVIKAAQDGFAAASAAYQTDTIALEEVWIGSLRWLAAEETAERVVAGTRMIDHRQVVEESVRYPDTQDRIVAVRNHLKRMQELQAKVSALLQGWHARRRGQKRRPSWTTTWQTLIADWRDWKMHNRAQPHANAVLESARQPAASTSRLCASSTPIVSAAEGANADVTARSPETLGAKAVLPDGREQSPPGAGVNGGATATDPAVRQCRRERWQGVGIPASYANFGNAG